MRIGILLVVAMSVGASRVSSAGERREAVDTAGLLATSYRVEPDVVYLEAAGWQGKLDLYLPRRPQGALPTAVLFHGGGWVTGTKDEVALDVLPYLAMGFAVVNVDYRLARTARAPAAVEDARCALRWVMRHAPQYGFDDARIVLVGSSAGAHLALMSALAPASAGFDRLCPGDEKLRVAAVVNFFGIVDVAQLLAPPQPRDFAVGWLGEAQGEAQTKEREALAKRVSPIEYVGAGAPAVLTLHGDADPVVPYAQSVRLHAALEKVGASSKLVTFRGGGHGYFGGDDVVRANHAVRDFLEKRGLAPAGKKWWESPPKDLARRGKGGGPDAPTPHLPR
jgi:acetyl esterase/lipase